MYVRRARSALAIATSREGGGRDEILKEVVQAVGMVWDADDRDLAANMPAKPADCVSATEPLWMRKAVFKEDVLRLLSSGQKSAWRVDFSWLSASLGDCLGASMTIRLELLETRRCSAQRELRRDISLPSFYVTQSCAVTPRGCDLSDLFPMAPVLLLPSTTMSDPEPRPLKRTRLSADDPTDSRSIPSVSSPASSSNLNRHPEIWYEDGNLVLVARETAFRIYRGLIAAQSTVFSDLFASSTSSPDEMFEECPVIHLSDSPQDLTHLLRVLLPQSRIQ